MAEESDSGLNFMDNLCCFSSQVRILLIFYFWLCELPLVNLIVWLLNYASKVYDLFGSKVNFVLVGRL